MTITCILPEKLYLSDIDSITTDELKKYKITDILNVSEIFEDFLFINILQLPIPDGINVYISKYFDECHMFIEKGRCVLVHCVAGLSRSPTIVISYLMKYKFMSLREAYEYVSEKRGLLCLNRGFISQLVEYEYHLIGKNTISVEELVEESVKYWSMKK